MRYLVVGGGVAGLACARALLVDGHHVTITDRAGSPKLDALAADGARVVVANPPPLTLLDDVDDVIVSPGVPPHDPLAMAAIAAGHDVYSEPELAWRRRGPDAPPWLAITGTNGKTTTTTMVAAILRAAGHKTDALGNIGEPLVFAATENPSTGTVGSRTDPAGTDPPGTDPAGTDPAGFDVLAVELSSFQLYWSSRLAPEIGAILNFADDHLEWHGTFDEYVRAKLDIWRGVTAAGGGIAIGNLDDPRVAAALAELGNAVVGNAVVGNAEIGGADSDGIGSGAITIGFTLGEPKPGQLGVVDGMLVDAVDWARTTAGCQSRSTRARRDATGADPVFPVPLIEAAAIRPAGAHNVSNALAAAAITRAYGVPAEAVRAGLVGYVPEHHRNAPVATVGGVRYVDDSKATNPHAAAASLDAYPSIVWIAGGQLKGVDVGYLVAEVAARLRGAVLLGVDRAEIAAALARHAPHVPVVDVSSTDDGAMGEVVRAAAAIARAGDTVLLAPAAASKDMYASYAARGDAFAAAVRALGIDADQALVDET